MALQRIQLKRRINAFCAVAVLTRPAVSFQVQRFPWHSSSSSSSLTSSHKLYSVSVNVEDDPIKWERMYQQTHALSDSLGGDLGTTPKLSSSSQIRVVTFDLDDTLWKTGATIAAANNALAVHLDSLGFIQPKRVEVVMGEIFQADKSRYAPVLGEQAKSPVLLTLLRKDAIAYIATEYNNYTLHDAQSLADEAFGIWKKGRHVAIPSHLAESVHDCLLAISNITTATGDKVIIGAITDGNSDPAILEDIGKFFDFCVNAEQVGIGKPNPEVYTRAIELVREQWKQSASTAGLDTLIDPDTFAVGPWWVHIGDDFVKDIVAAKDFSMRSVWSRELVLHKLSATQAVNATAAPATNKSLTEFDKEIASQSVVKMQIGSQDYLTESLEREFADGIVDRFHDIVQLLTGWHKDGLDSASTSIDTDSAASTVEVIEEEAVELAMDSKVVADNGQTAAATKFCMFCGQNLQMTAKFCSSCGEKQE